MKKTIFTFVLSVLLTAAALASTNPVKDVKLIDTENVIVSIDVTQSSVFTAANFNAVNESLVFETKDDISFIQIFNEQGDLEFQLPVMSNKVTIGKGIIGAGEYKLGFMIKGLDKIQFTQVNIK